MGGHIKPFLTQGKPILISRAANTSQTAVAPWLCVATTPSDCLCRTSLRKATPRMLSCSGAADSCCDTIAYPTTSLLPYFLAWRIPSLPHHCGIGDEYGMQSLLGSPEEGWGCVDGSGRERLTLAVSAFIKKTVKQLHIAIFKNVQRDCK